MILLGDHLLKLKGENFIFIYEKSGEKKRKMGDTIASMGVVTVTDITLVFVTPHLVVTPLVAVAVRGRGHGNDLMALSRFRHFSLISDKCGNY